MRQLKSWKDELDRKKESILASEKGVIPYLVAWLLGVPASILVIIFLLRG